MYEYCYGNAVPPEIKTLGKTGVIPLQKCAIGIHSRTWRPRIYFRIRVSL
jgi:hypothetical protein